MGTNDLARELRARSCPAAHPLVPHLATALLAAREAGKVILDGVYNDVKDPSGFRAECVQGWEMGFDGKTLIHPGQVDDRQRRVGAERRRGRPCPAGDRGVRGRPCRRARAWSPSTGG